MPSFQARADGASVRLLPLTRERQVAGLERLKAKKAERMRALQLRARKFGHAQALRWILSLVHADNALSIGKVEEEIRETCIELASIDGQILRLKREIKELSL